MYTDVYKAKRMLLELQKAIEVLEKRWPEEEDA